MFFGKLVWRAGGSGDVLRARGHGWAEEKDFSATLTPGDFTKTLKFLLTHLVLRAGRKEPLASSATLTPEDFTKKLKFLPTHLVLRAGREAGGFRSGLATRYPCQVGEDRIAH